MLENLEERNTLKFFPSPIIEKQTFELEKKKLEITVVIGGGNRTSFSSAMKYSRGIHTLAN